MSSDDNKHCSDLERDRKTGLLWEKNFCKLASDRGFMLTPLQIGRQAAASAYKARRRVLLPDIVLWTYPGQYHEIKHKNPTKYGSYGLEKYRFDALVEFAAESRQGVFYTIHDHDLAGGRGVAINDIHHWRTVSILQLVDTWEYSGPGATWWNGQKVSAIIYYWSSKLWIPLLTLWKG